MKSIAPSKPAFSMTLVYANYCGHCSVMMPEWNKFSAQNGKGTIWEGQCKIEKVESADLERIREVLGSISMLRFPTIVFQDHIRGKTVEYNQERTAEALQGFVNREMKKAKPTTAPKTKKTTTATKPKKPTTATKPKKPNTALKTKKPTTAPKTKKPTTAPKTKK